MKGKTALNSNGGRSVVRDLFRWLRDQRISVTAIAQEKALMAAAVLIEDCTDPMYNAEYDDRWTWDTRLKEPLAEGIVRTARQDLLANAWRERNGTDEQAFVDAYRDLLASLALVVDDRVAREALRMQRADFHQLWESMATLRGTHGGYSPNHAAFTSLLMNAERHAEARGRDGVELVHDEQAQYKDVFQEVWAMIRGNGVDQARTTLPNQSEVIFGLKRLVSFAFSDSTKHVGLQFADFVASALRVALMEGRAANRSRTYLDALQDLLGDASLSEPYAIGTETWQLEAITRMLGRDPRRFPRPAPR